MSVMCVHLSIDVVADDLLLLLLLITLYLFVCVCMYICMNGLHMCVRGHFARLFSSTTRVLAFGFSRSCAGHAAHGAIPQLLRMGFLPPSPQQVLLVPSFLMAADREGLLPAPAAISPGGPRTPAWLSSLSPPPPRLR